MALEIAGVAHGPGMYFIAVDGRRRSPWPLATGVSAWTEKGDLMATTGRTGPRPSARCSRRLLRKLVLYAAVAMPGAGAAWAQNLAWNGDFAADVSGWEPHAGGSLVWTNLSDESDCPASGMGLSTSVEVSTLYVATVEQCVPDLTPGTNLAVAAGHLGYGQFAIELDFWGTIDCESGWVSSLGSPYESQDPVIWSSARLATTVPAAAHSVRVRLSAVDFAPHGLGVDGVVVALRPPILLDDFEADDAGSALPCRWD